MSESMTAETSRSMPAPRRYLHGDYLEPNDRGVGSVVYCGFCDGFCLPEHFTDEHKVADSKLRLNASKKSLYRSQQSAERPVDAANYFDGTPDPA